MCGPHRSSPSPVGPTDVDGSPYPCDATDATTLTSRSRGGRLPRRDGRGRGRGRTRLERERQGHRRAGGEGRGDAQQHDVRPAGSEEHDFVRGQRDARDRTWCRRPPTRRGSRRPSRTRTTPSSSRSRSVPALCSPSATSAVSVPPGSRRGRARGVRRRHRFRAAELEPDPLQAASSRRARGSRALAIPSPCGARPRHQGGRHDVLARRDADALDHIEQHPGLAPTEPPKLHSSEVSDGVVSTPRPTSCVVASMRSSGTATPRAATRPAP